MAQISSKIGNVLGINQKYEQQQTQEFLEEYRKLCLKYQRDFAPIVQIVKINTQQNANPILTPSAPSNK